MPEFALGLKWLLTGKARQIGPAIEQIYNEVYALAVQDISRQELEAFVELFGRMSENFVRAQADK